MKKYLKKWLRPLLFILGSAWVGLAMYYSIGCSTGLCVLTSNPWVTMAYMGFVGWLLSTAFPSSP